MGTNKAATTIIVIMGVGLAAGAVFFFTREAAAASKAKTAFAVDPDCGSFLVVNEEQAKGALIAATLAVSPAPTARAIDALKAILTKMFPQCDWNDPPDGRTFVRGAQHLTWKDIESAVDERTVAEVRAIAEKFSDMQSASPLPWPFVWGFGTGGCFSCMKMARGGRVTPKDAFGSGGELVHDVVGHGSPVARRSPAARRRRRQ